MKQTHIFQVLLLMDNNKDLIGAIKGYGAMQSIAPNFYIEHLGLNDLQKFRFNKIVEQSFYHAPYSLKLKIMLDVINNICVG